MSDGINKGFRKAQGKWVIWLNADDRLKPGALKAVIDAMNAHHAIPAAQEVGVTTLRLIIDKVPGLREEAIKLGAKPEWLDPLVKEMTGMTSSMTSFRRMAATGIGTARRMFKPTS